MQPRSQRSFVILAACGLIGGGIAATAATSATKAKAKPKTTPIAKRVTALEKKFKELKAQVGSTGATGSQGSNGSTGSSGTSGLNGTSGSTGATGATGAKGDTGSSGAEGPAGPQGPAGARGATGPQGAQGLQGVEGPTGPAGPAGGGGGGGGGSTFRRVDTPFVSNNTPGQTFQVQSLCAVGETIVGGGFDIGNTTQATIRASIPESSASPNRWVAIGTSQISGDITGNVYAVCAS
jgi:hypothetical protein